jgi:hypothetical protein
LTGLIGGDGLCLQLILLGSWVDGEAMGQGVLTAIVGFVEIENSEAQQ